MLGKIKPIDMKQVDKVNGNTGMFGWFEKCVCSLRNYSDHSTPFLKPVNKKEAPNYYEGTIRLISIRFYRFIIQTHQLSNH